MLARSFLIESSSKLLVTRTGIKGQSSLNLGRIRPLILELLALEWRKFHIWTWISLKPVGQFWSYFMCSIIGMRERLDKVLGQVGSKLWFPWQQKAPLTYNGENDVFTFSRLFLIRSFLYLLVRRTCIKSQISARLDHWLGRKMPLRSKTFPIDL